ncbi:ABC transporter ATP-binding protein/permease [Paenibacillus oenotherae]|uniref:ABC transporter ATP-binding protein/permease n=1 Tax=Paenibacillus oenotherae TaxID=1435645 RepID=A0ABS7DAI0_9BACL|nr:ABC transporter ATP-binding protein [Paenibacillus oenotherae]MBW7476945.1 ABC transporter ATP-binding protein/permease [Paenibacillus oenotherae]
MKLAKKERIGLFANWKDHEAVRMLSLLKLNKWRYLIGVLGDCGASVSLQILLAFVFKNLIETSINRDQSSLASAIAIVCTAVVILAVLSPFFGYLYKKSVKTLMTRLKLQLFERLSIFPVSYFEKRHSGDVMSRLTNDVQIIEDVFLTQIRSLAYMAMMSVSGLAAMFLLDARIALVLVGITVLSIVSVAAFSRSLRQLSDSIQHKLGRLTEQATDMLTGLLTIRMFGLSGRFNSKYASVNGELTATSIRHGRKSGHLEATNYFLGFLNFGGIILIGVWMVANRWIEISVIVALVQLQLSVSMVFLDLGRILTQFQTSAAGVRRITELLNEPVEPERLVAGDEAGYAAGIAAESGKAAMIQFDGVAFGYEQDKPILQGLNMSIGRGEMAALVGSSGGGKSTVMKLLLGFYPPGEGQITIAGQRMEQYSLAELRDSMMYVPQDTYLFHGTIASNIRLGKPDASMEEVVQAAQSAHIHAFIESLPDRYETMIGERGAKLSGGQKQRIAIARALLKNAPILLLDEATSALDSESEQLVQQAINRLMENRTTLVIAHRLSTIKNADIIYVVDEGKVVEQGNHDSLYGAHGLYHQLCTLQFSKEAGSRSRDSLLFAKDEAERA